METLFYISVAFIAYTYVGYPALMLAWGLIFGRRVEKRYGPVPVSVVIAARDEADRIVPRIENLLAQDYPRELVEIIVVSDGSVDATAEMAGRFAGLGVRVIDIQSPVGKSTALNRGVEAATSDIVVFADARQRFGDNVLAELVAMFADERVGAVSGELVIEAQEGSEVQEGVGLYWEYEKLIRRMESRAGSVVGATGSIYAIRRELYRPLAPNTLLDDVVVPMRIVLAGYRSLFVRSARAYDRASTTARQEFRRKVRTLAGNFQAVAMEPRLLSPFHNPVFLQFVSHKLARLAVPYFAVAAIVSSAALPGPFYAAAFWFQIVFLVAGLAAGIASRYASGAALGRTLPGRMTRVFWTFTVLNAAAVMGLWVFVTGREATVWKRD